MKLVYKLSPIMIAVVLSTTFLTACKEDQTKGNSAASAKQTVNVEVITLEAQPFTVKTALPGRITPYRVAEIRPQVNGTILKREFTESSDVKAGESLYRIDPAIYDATYKSAVANLASMKASAKVAQINANRMRSLISSNAVSKQEYDNALAAAEQAKANVDIAQASLNTAKVNLDYTKVLSPINGYVGKSNVTEGALVSANQATPLTVVQQLDPIYIDMTQSVDEYAVTQQRLSSGQYVIKDKNSQVELTFNDGSVYPYKGQLEFTDISVNETTGSIALRAVFPNPDRTLLPGMFIRPVLIEGVIENALLVPQRSVNRNAQGIATVKVVNAEGLIETKEIDATKTFDSQWVVNSGLNVGDKVIVSGLLALNSMPPGVPVYANIIQKNAAQEAPQTDAPATK